MTHANRPNQKLSAPRRGFTLAEVIVAIGILAVIGVVVGSIFASVGDTVTNGRQVSNLNRFVARVERVMRRDFDNMVREDGFMVIRNEYTNLYNGQTPTRLPVGLTVTDPAPRARRIDEIMFFTRGEFTSRRTPLHPDMLAQSDVARVYYGHGQQMPEDFGPNPDNPDLTTRYARPRIDETNANITVNGAMVESRLGQPSGLGVVNPNEFASDWSLLRHVTLLVPRPSGIQTVPDSVSGLFPNINEAAYNRVADSSRQIALGPAQQSVFRTVAEMLPYESFPRSGQYLRENPVGRSIRPLNGFSAILGGADAPANETLVTPLTSSGVVDVAVGNLQEIRNTVTRPWLRPSPGAMFFAEITPLGVDPSVTRFGYEAARAQYDLNGTQMVGTTLASTPPAQPYATGVPNAQTQQLWMFDALPSVPYNPNAAIGTTGQRVRFEDVPPRVYAGDGTIPGDDDQRRQIAIEQADQEMLASSVFVPRCTEFIVEFSFGIVNRDTADPNYGQQIWHGLRRSDTTGRVIVDGFGPQYNSFDLVDQSQFNNDRYAIRGALGADAFEDGNQPQNPIPGAIDQEIIELVRLVQRFPIDGNPDDDNIAEYAFGYSYRDWNTDTDGDGAAAGDDDDVERDWPWPRMVRVTMRFVDPADLEDEQTFQFEFRVPGLRGRL